MIFRRSFLPLVALACAGVGGCAHLIPPFDDVGPLRELAPELIEGAHINGIHVVSDGPVAGGYGHENESMPYSGDSDGRSSGNVVENEVAQETRLCATGPRRLYMRIRLEEFRFDERLRSLRDGQGAHVAAGWVTLVDPAIKDGDPVVGRYYIRTGTRSGNFVERLLTDWRAATGEEFGREVCSRIFGRNPRPQSPWDNATEG